MILDKASPDLMAVTDCRYGRMIHLKQDQYIGKALLDYGEYSESEVELWRQLLKPEAVVADIGANIGAHTVALASLVPKGAVFAFEPLRFMYHTLCGNIALNGITNALPFLAAVGKAKGTITVPGIDYTPAGNYGGLALGSFDQGNQVPVVRLDDVLPVVDFIKADVEGMEGDVLLGAERLIDQCEPVLYLENNPGPKQDALIQQVQELGYDAWWHLAPHFNPNNHRGNPVNHYEEGLVSYNLLCFPGDSAASKAIRTKGTPPIPRVSAA
jgi:FkbM family methyltransferase